jgi:hypothetical protein
MNILEAIEAMREGKKVRRRCNRREPTSGKTWSKCYLVLHPRVSRLVIFLVEYPDLVLRVPVVVSLWKPGQSDLFADDFQVVG